MPRNLPLDPYQVTICVNLAKETVRFWTTQRTPEGVTAAFCIFDQIAVELEKSPHLLDTEDLIYWLDGRTLSPGDASSQRGSGCVADCLGT
jgi:hypothetical protein